METKEQIDELMIWLAELSAGKRLATYDLDEVTPIVTLINDIPQLVQLINTGEHIQTMQIKIPAPPDGESWHNPDELSGEQIDIDDGWRLLLVSELNSLRDDNLLPCRIWVSTALRWSNGNVSGGNVCDTYRVNAKKHPVGSLRPVADLSREKIQEQVTDQMLDIIRECDVGDLDDLDDAMMILEPIVREIVRALFLGKFKHLEIKYG